MDLDKRNCKNIHCQKSFKCLSKSDQEFCSAFCEMQVNGQIWQGRRRLKKNRISVMAEPMPRPNV